MKPSAFDYAVPTDVHEATGAIEKANGTAKFVSGNQSLGPMLNLRLVRTKSLIDVSFLPNLRRVEEVAGEIFIGAATTHAEIEDGIVIDPTDGWMRSAASNIAYRAVRNRGTIGGSLCHADPAADWVIVLTGLCADAVISGPNGERQIPISEFIKGPFSTTLCEGELLLGVKVSRPSKDAAWGYWKYVRQVGEFAKASASVYHDPARGIARCTVGALGRHPLIIENSQSVIDGTMTPTDALRAALPMHKASDLILHVTALTRALAKACGEAEI